MSSSPVSRSSSFEVNSSSHPLPRDTERWWKQKPDLFEPLTFRTTNRLSYNISPSRILNTRAARSQISLTGFKKFSCALWETLCAKWQKGSLVLASYLSKPSILFGIVLTLVGLIGLFTAITGIKIPLLFFVAEHIPESIIVSLTIIRAGVQSIVQGVRRSRRNQRARLEAEQYTHQLRLQQFFMRVREQDRAHKTHKIDRLNARLPSSMRLEHLLPVGYPYSKVVDDLPTSSHESYKYRLDVLNTLTNNEFEGKEILLAELPALDEPNELSSATTRVTEVDTERKIEHPRPSKFNEKWNNWWQKKIPALGMLDIITGQMMLFCAIGSIVLMFLPANQVPAIFQLLARDPGLSLTFSFILLANWVNSCRTGWRMLGWQQSEARRNSIAADLRLIDLGLEKKKVTEFHEWINRRLDEVQEADPESVGEVRAAIAESYEYYVGSLPDFQKKVNEAHALRAEVKAESENCLVYGIQKLGEKIIPKFANPTIFVGLMITIIGAACLVMSVTHHIPPQLALLAKNTPLSVLFSTGLLVTGLHAAHRGISTSDRNKKERWKKTSHMYRDMFLRELYPELEHPQLSEKFRNKWNEIRTISGNREINLDAPLPDRQEQRQAVASCCRNLSHKWFTVWRKTLHVIWMPDFVLGCFLLFSSFAGLAICCGIPAPASLQFISADPRFSIFFCLSLSSIALDALNASWRMATYHQRKKRDKKNLDLLIECYDRFTDPPPQHPPNYLRV